MAQFLDDELNGKHKKEEDSSAKEKKTDTTKEEKKSEKKVEKSINGKKESDGESKKKKVIKSIHRNGRSGKNTTSPSNSDNDILEGEHQPLFISKKQTETS